MSTLDRKNQIRISLNNGHEINIPRAMVASVVMPGIVIRRSFHRLEMDISDYQKSVDAVIRKAKL